MVSPSKPKRIETGRAMGSPSTFKSKPPRNYELRDPKWAMKNTNNLRLRKLSVSSYKSPQRGDYTDFDSDNNNRKGSSVCEAPPKNGAFPNSSPDRGNEKKKNVVNGSPVLLDNNSGSKATPSEARPKIYVRLRLNNKKPVDDVSNVEEDPKFKAEDIEEEVPKTWNLRPRKPISMNENALMIGASANANKTSAKKEKKPKFSISLTKEEIEKDFLAMTGSLPSKKPTRRPKNVQKELDFLFPGLRLDSITPNSYKVPESPRKAPLKP